MKKSILRRALSGFLAGAIAAGGMVIAGAADLPVIESPTTVSIINAVITTYSNTWNTVDEDGSETVNLWMNGGTVNLNPGAGTTKVGGKAVQLEAFAQYGFAIDDDSDLIYPSNLSDFFDVTASPDVKWYVGAKPAVYSSEEADYVHDATTDETTTTLANAGIDGYGTFVKRSSAGVESTKLAKGLAISVSKGKVSAIISNDNLTKLLTADNGYAYTEYVKLYSYDSAKKTEKFLTEIPVIVRYASKEVVLYDNDDSKEGTKATWAAKTVQIGEAYELNFGGNSATANNGLASENTYMIKSDVPGAIGFAVDMTDTASADPDDGRLVAGDIGWYPALTGVTQDEAMQVYFRAQSLKDVVKTKLVAHNAKWINQKYLGERSDQASKVTKADLLPPGAPDDSYFQEDSFTAAITAKIGTGKTYTLIGDAYDAYSQEYDKILATQKDKATAANIIITNEKSGKTLKLKVNINNFATTVNTAFNDAAFPDNYDPRNIAIPDTGRSVPVFDLYKENAIVSDVETMTGVDISGVDDTSASTTTITDKATVMVIADDAEHTKAASLMGLSSADTSGTLISTKLMKLSKGVYNFALNTVEFPKPTGITISAKMLPSNAQVQLTVTGKTLGEPMYATVIVGYGQKFTDVKDSDLYDNIVVIPIRIQNDMNMVGEISKFTVGRTSVPVNTGNVSESGKVDPDTTWNPAINDVFGIDGVQDGSTFTTVKTDSGALSGSLNLTTVPGGTSIAEIKKIAASGTAKLTPGVDGGYTIDMKDDETITFAVKMTGYYDGVLTATNDRYYIFDITGTNYSITDAVAPIYSANLDTEDEQLKLNATMNLTVKASSSDGGYVTYQWYHATALDAEGTALAGQTNRTLSLTPAVKAAAGIDSTGTKYFYCVATNNNHRAETKTNSVKSAVKTIIFQSN
jgi:hypothetical protein